MLDKSGLVSQRPDTAATRLAMVGPSRANRAFRAADRASGLGPRRLQDRDGPRGMGRQRDLAFGHDGKPMYISGPYDDGAKCPQAAPRRLASLGTQRQNTANFSA